ncbi:MAG: lysophospholipid acyltransferase family protein [Planctomycetia bacterium]|nr:lysophospholipid acyltransferase family protein [Planctomycetia bacterium]
MKRVVDYLVYIIVRLVISAIQSLPMHTCAALADKLSWLLSDVLHVRQKVIDDNLRHAFPNLSEHERQLLTRRHWEHILLLIFEMAHADRKIHETNWRRFVRLLSPEVLVRHLLNDRPTVIVSGHFGNFEISARMLGLYGFQTFAVARPLDNPFIDRWLNAFRRRYGQCILPKKGSAPEAESRLAAGGILAVLADQSAGPKGCFVEFFGRPASTHKAIAVMALAHEAPLMVCYARRADGPLNFEIGTEGIVDPCKDEAAAAGVRELTAWYTQRLEAVIRRDPEQYWWVHRRWKEQPPQRAQRRKAA